MELKEQVLSRLLTADGGFVSGGALSQELGVSRNAVWKAIARLREEGCAVEAVTNRGYRLSAMSDRLQPAAIQAALRTRRLGRVLYVHDELPSTNQTARELAAAGAAGGTTVVAERQTAGRGRRGRQFDSPDGAGLYMSVVLRPENWSGDPTLLTSCAAVAAARAIEQICPVSVQIKWVNDLFAGGKKVCGILTEAGLGLESGELEYAVLGIGINTARREFPQELQPIATSLGNVTGESVSRSALLAALLTQLEPALHQMGDGAFLEESRRRSLLLGREVTVLSAQGDYTARAAAIDDRGHLVVELPDGVRRTLSSGEVSVRL